MKAWVKETDGVTELLIGRFAENAISVRSWPWTGTVSEAYVLADALNAAEDAVPRVEHDCDAGVAKATSEERQRVIELCLGQYRYWRDVEADAEDRTLVLVAVAMGAMGAASSILAGVMSSKG